MGYSWPAPLSPRVRHPIWIAPPSTAAIAAALVGWPLAAEPLAAATASTGAKPAADDLLVTARRREERAQDVPVALSVVTAETLQQAGAVSLPQIARLVPSLQLFSFNPRNTNVNIRGLGSNVALANDGFEQGVGIFIDGIYYGRIGQSQFDLVDLEKVEVLRGPQSTLFGKNTTAGAISISSKAPSFTTSLTAEATLGSFDRTEWRVSATGPIADDIAAIRISGAWSRQDGTILNVRTGRRLHDTDMVSLRGQLLLRPADAVELRIIADFSRSRSACCIGLTAGRFLTYSDGTPIPNNIDERTARAGYTLQSLDPADRQTDANDRVRADMDGYGVSAQLDWDLGSAALTAITAARWWDWNPQNDSDALGLSIVPIGRQVNRQRQLSQEIRLASTGERRLDWLVGLFLFRQVVRGATSVGYGPAAADWLLPQLPSAISTAALDGFRADSTSDPRTWSGAAFGQLGWAATDRLTLTGGLRLTYEEKTGSFVQRQTEGMDLSRLPPSGAAIAQAVRNSLHPQVSYTAKTSGANLSGLVNAAWTLDRDALLYAGWSRGEKSAGLDLTASPASITTGVRPERVDSFEVGLKSQLLDRRLTLNLAGYWMIVRDFQTVITEQSATTVAFRQFIANIPEVRSRGFELDATWVPAGWLRLTGGLAFTDARYVDYANAPTPVETLNRASSADLSGASLSGVPRWSWALTADTTHRIGRLGGRRLDLYGSADWSVRSSYNSSVSNSRYAQVEGYGLLGGRLGLRTDDGLLDLSLFARNLFDRSYLQALSPTNFGLVTGLVGEPRTIGVTVRTRI